MVTSENDALVARVAALEAELAAMKQRLDEPLHQVQDRRIRQFLAARQNKRIRSSGELNLFQPTLFLGAGEIVIGDAVLFGFNPSPFLLSGYIYVEARNAHSTIRIGDRVFISNNAVFCAEGDGISIGDDTLIGTNVEILDTDGHDLAPDRRKSGQPKTAKVTIGRNVFLGSNTKVMKGVQIGDDSVIGNGSIVTSSIPSGVIASGNPARPVKSL